MKKLMLLTILLFCALSNLIIAPVSSQEKMGPHAFVTSPIYRFDPVVDGKKILHAYIIQNTGDAVLAIQKVETG